MPWPHRSPHPLLLLSWLSACTVRGFGGLRGASDSHPQAGKAFEACERCHHRLRHALGYEWMQCVVDDLLEQQKDAIAQQREDYFPMVRHDMDPFRPAASSFSDPGMQVASLLKDLMRNYTCDVEDGGSKPLRSFTWRYTPKEPCPPRGEDSVFSYKPGFLPAGDDIERLAGRMTEEDAKALCERDHECAGVTFSSRSRAPAAEHPMIFKKAADDVTPADGWHTHQKRHLDPGCAEGGSAYEPRSFKVDVLRESPPVYLVNDFLTHEECEHMVNVTVPRMGPSVVGGGGTSNYRRSYSVNMAPNFDDQAHTVTRWARRKFSFAREVAGYEHVIEGDGQEPINAVYYKDYGDEYRPHCDGECNGGRYSMGTRVATSLSYCVTAGQGGFTVFTKRRPDISVDTS